MHHMDAKGDTPDLRAARIASRQHGVVSVEQLRGVGLERGAVQRRVAAGRLHRIHRGVYAVGHPGISFQGRWMAATLAYGEGAVVSHRSAAALWELLRRQNGLIDVSLPGRGGRQKRQGIRLHRCPSLLPASVTRRWGIPVTTPARTISDLRGVASGWEVRRAVRQAEVLGLPLGPEVTSDGTRSDLERDFLRLCRRHRLPEPEVNVRVGSHLADFLWRDRRLVVETDGYWYHRGRQAFEDDRARDLALRARGFEVLRVSEKQVDEEPGRVAEVLRTALASARHRVGPDGHR
jgi:very-short-patch-repair endonuclease